MSPIPTIGVTVDLDTGSFTIGIDDLGLSLRTLLAALPAAVAPGLAWVPDLQLSSAGLTVDPARSDLGCYLLVDDAGNPLATVIFVGGPGPAGTPVKSGLVVELLQGVDLGSIPVVGKLLQGVGLSDVTAAYASGAFADHEIELPDAGALPALPAGFGLGVTLAAAGTSQRLSLGSNGFQAQLDRAGDRQPDTDPAPAINVVEWFPIQKKLGPLDIQRLGIAAQGGVWSLMADASLLTAMVSVGLQGFSVQFSSPDILHHPPTIGLSGLSIDATIGSVVISGGLQQTTTNGYVEYDGDLVIRAGSYGIAAVGSYASVDGVVSMFVFGMANGVFGGPPAFFVTGLAAGFGINRALAIPTVDKIRTFPLVAAALTGPGFAGGSRPDTAALAALSAAGAIPPQAGSYWGAIGIEFTSFSFLNGFALAVITVGHGVEVALLGVEALRLPMVADDSPPFAFVELAIEADCRPDEGALSIVAVLTDNSYLIDPSCRLTGGFAFACWFGPHPHAGDFVITAGGFHPAFTPPAWYPTVPRLGLSWQVSDAITISGDCYFALTPACVMGGGRLLVLFAASNLRAWFVAQADFLMSWRPFHYQGDLSLSIGVAYTLAVGAARTTLKAEISVDVTLWGPPFRGVAHVDLCFVSFTISINGGDRPPASVPSVIDWATFVATSLPSAAGPAPASAAGPGAPESAAVGDPAPAGSAVCQIRPSDDLRSTLTSPSGESIWVFGGSVGFTTASAIPSTVAQVLGADPAQVSGPPVNVYPMGVVSVVSTHTVCIAAADGAPWTSGQELPDPIVLTGWTWTAQSSSVSPALWGPRPADGSTDQSAALVTALTGTTIQAPGARTTGDLSVPTLGLEALPAKQVLMRLAPIDAHGPAAPIDSRAVISAGIRADSVAGQARAEVVAALHSIATSGTSTLTAGDPARLAAHPDLVFTCPPMVGPLGCTGPAAAAAATTRWMPRPAPRVRRRRPAAPRPLALFRPNINSRTTVLGGFPRSTVLVDDRLSSSAERARLSAALRADIQDPAWHHLTDGTTAVWTLAPTTASTLTVSGSGDVWAVGLDEQGSVLIDTVVRSTRGVVPLPVGTARVALTARSGDHDPTPVGWECRSRLRRVAPQTLLADGFVLRPQAPRHPRTLRETRVMAETTTAEVLVHNRFQGQDGPARGWLEASFRSATPGWFDLRTRPSGPAALPDGSAPGCRTPAHILQPADVRRDGDETVWRYRRRSEDVDESGRWRLRLWEPPGGDLVSVRLTDDDPLRGADSMNGSAGAMLYRLHTKGIRP